MSRSTHSKWRMKEAPSLERLQAVRIPTLWLMGKAELGGQQGGESWQGTGDFRAVSTAPCDTKAVGSHRYAFVQTQNIQGQRLLTPGSTAFAWGQGRGGAESLSQAPPTCSRWGLGSHCQGWPPPLAPPSAEVDT